MKELLSRRKFLRMAAAMTAGSVVAACTTSTIPTSSDAEQAEKKTGAVPDIQVSLIYWEDAEGPMQAEAFMETRPEVKFELIPFAGEDAKLDGMIAAGTPPDLFPLGDVNFIKYFVAGNLLNLQPLIEADSAFDLSIYFPRILRTSQAPNGDLYALGPDFGAQLLYYNKTLFDEAGLSYPNEEWTWQDMQEAAGVLTKGEGATKQFGTMPHNWWAVQFPLVWQNGGNLFTEDGTKCLMDTPEAIEALDYMASYVRQEWAPTPQQLSGMGMESGQLFATGRAGMMPGGHWEFNAFSDSEAFEWDVTVVPRGQEEATFLHQAFWSVSSTTEVPEVCWEWLKFTCGPEWSEKFALEVGGMSSVMSVAEKLATNPPEGTASGVAKVWKALFGSALRGRSVYNVVPFLEIVDSAWGPAVDSLWSGDSTAEQTGQEIAANANKILDREA
jgi:multiple sugar transport system substrate-binding protein